MEESDGVGLNKLQFTIRMPMSLGLTPVLAKSASSAPNMTDSASARASFMLKFGGLDVIPLGRYVSSPRPDRLEIRL
uniref:3-ketoacyl-CoA synthase 1 n=1 Tax=Rhizophora mucronata TaxID=61149 RepID=A0A2P2QQP1_RHIMU